MSATERPQRIMLQYVKHELVAPAQTVAQLCHLLLREANKSHQYLATDIEKMLESANILAELARTKLNRTRFEAMTSASGEELFFEIRTLLQQVDGFREVLEVVARGKGPTLRALALILEAIHKHCTDIDGAMGRLLRYADPMPTVFISHSSEDREFVESQIVHCLKENGVESWYSKDSIMGASRWEREILQGLKKCDWFLVAMSPRAAQSKWVKFEVDWAFARRQEHIIPVLIADCDPDDFHIGMAGIHNIDLRAGSRDSKRRLLEILGGPPALPTNVASPIPVPIPRNR